MPDRWPHLIEVPLPKGVRLFLTAEELERGLRRGKAIRRARAMARRLSDEKPASERGERRSDAG